MQVQDRRRDLGLAQHVVDLAAVVGLVVEEVRHQQPDRIFDGPTLVVEVAQGPAQEPVFDAGREGSDPRLLFPLASRSSSKSSYGIASRFVEGTSSPAKRASQIRSATIRWLSVPWMLPKNAFLHLVRSLSGRRPHAS